jgi:hypothetical protein
VAFSYLALKGAMEADYFMSDEFDIKEVLFEIENTLRSYF